MSGEELTRRQIVDACDGMLTTIAKLHEQVLALKRKAEGINPIGEVLTCFDEHWKRRYAGAAQTRYEFVAADASHVKRWLKTMDAPTLKNRIARYFADADDFYRRNKHPFYLFVKNINKYSSTMAPTETQEVLGAQVVVDCKHLPPCGTDAEHTRRRMEDMRATS